MDLKEATARIAAQGELVSRIRDEVSKVIVGQALQQSGRYDSESRAGSRGDKRSSKRR